MQDTNEKLRLTCGVTAAHCTDHVRVPSPMIGQYTLDLRVNSIRDTGNMEKKNTTTNLMCRQGIRQVAPPRMR